MGDHPRGGAAVLRLRPAAEELGPAPLVAIRGLLPPGPARSERRHDPPRELELRARTFRPPTSIRRGSPRRAKGVLGPPPPTHPEPKPGQNGVKGLRRLNLPRMACTRSPTSQLRVTRVLLYADGRRSRRPRGGVQPIAGQGVGILAVPEEVRRFWPAIARLDPARRLLATRYRSRVLAEEEDRQRQVLMRRQSAALIAPAAVEWFAQASPNSQETTSSGPAGDSRRCAPADRRHRRGDGRRSSRSTGDEGQVGAEDLVHPQTRSSFARPPATGGCRRSASPPAPCSPGAPSAPPSGNAAWRDRLRARAVATSALLSMPRRTDGVEPAAFLLQLPRHEIRCRLVA